MNYEMIKVHIADLMKARGVSRYRLALDTGLAYTTLWNLERGHTQSISFDVVEKVCNRLDCTPGDLFSIEKDGKRKKG